MPVMEKAPLASLEELVGGYTAYTDPTEIGLEMRAGDYELGAWLSSISLTVTISTLITGCG